MQNIQCTHISSTLTNVLNPMYLQVQACGSECVIVDTISRLNVRGSLLASSGTKSSGKIWRLVSGIQYLVSGSQVPQPT